MALGTRPIGAGRIGGDTSGSSLSIAAAPAWAIATAALAVFASTSSLNIDARPAVAVTAAPQASFSTTTVVHLDITAAPAAATAGAPAASFDSTSTLSITALPAGSVASAPAAAVTFSNDIDVSGRAAWSLGGAPSAYVLIGTIPAETDTGNRAGGRARSGLGIASFDPPVVDLPAGLVAGVSYPQAQAFGAVTLVGNQPTFTVATARGDQTRVRVMYGNRDISYLFGVPTPPLEKQTIEPFMYGPATQPLPQFNAAFEKAGQGRWSWLRPGKPVHEQRVLVSTGEVVATTYRGISTGFDTDGNTLTVAIGGQAAGRMGLRDQQLPLFGGAHDIKQLMNRVFESIRVPFDNSGDDTGIVLDRFGGTGLLDYGQQILARAWTRAGNQWTVMPSEDGTYSILRKDTTTVDFTVYLDDARTTLSGHRDISEEPTDIFGSGTTPEGKRVRNGVYPGLIESTAAPYPMDDNSAFGVGFTNGDTDTGDGMSVLKARLQTFGLLDRDDADDGDGEFTDSVEAAVIEVQDLANLPLLGVMNPITWRALFNLDVTGHSIWWARIVPMAQLRATRKWNRSPDGSIMGINPDWDVHRIPVHRTIDYGSGMRSEQMHEFSHSELAAANDPNWVGELVLGLGGSIRGDHTQGDPIGDVMADWEHKPGMNGKIVTSAGGELLVHVAGIASGSGPARLSVDTRARDILPLWEVIRRNKESRKDPARRYANDNRASGQTKDVLTEFEEYGGRVEPVFCPAGEWTVFPVVVGKEGEIAKFRLRTGESFDDTGVLTGGPTRFVVAVFGDPIGKAKLASMEPDPLTDKAGWTDPDFRRTLDRDHRLLYIAGETGDLCGYWPGSQADGDDITGKHQDDSPFHYNTGKLNVARVAIFPQADTWVLGGRILWNQEIVGS